MSEEYTKNSPEGEEEATVIEETAAGAGGADVRENAEPEQPDSADESNDTEPSGDEEAAEEEDSTGAEHAEEAASEDPEEPAADEVEEPAAGEPTKEQAAAEAEEEKSRRMRWYVVHTYSGRENKVKDTTERMIRNSEMKDQFGKVLVATEEVAEMKKGKKKVSQRKLFPSYILIEMEMTDEAWGMIENVPGVTHFVGEGKKPFPIPKKEVDRILGRMVKKEGVVPEVPYTIGEHVKVVDGPFTDFSGIVDEINPERGKLKVLVSIFGRDTPVELDFLQVKSI